MNASTTIFNIVEFPQALNLTELEIVYPTFEDYEESLDISAALLRKGTPMPAVYIMIAAMCIRRDLTLSTRDKHFVNIKAVRTSFNLQLTK
ncbi:MAG: PIN domain-containing protein [Candidatus Bathyarchaeia archaeon]